MHVVDRNLLKGLRQYAPKQALSNTDASWILHNAYNVPDVDVFMMLLRQKKFDSAPAFKLGDLN